MQALFFGLQAWRKEYKFRVPMGNVNDALANLIDGQTVAIVGNAAFPDKAETGERIDSCEVVIRLNHCEGVGRPECGKKTDAVVIAPASLWSERMKATANLVYGGETVPKVFLSPLFGQCYEGSVAGLINTVLKKHVLGLEEIGTFARSKRLKDPDAGTTGTRLLCAVADIIQDGLAKPKSILLAHFSFGDEWLGYTATEARHYTRLIGYRPLGEMAVRVKAVKDCFAEVIH